MSLRRLTSALSLSVEAPDTPGALAQPPSLPSSLSRRTVRVPMSLLVDALHDLADVLGQPGRRLVVVFTQEYGVAHRGAAATLDAILEARKYPRILSATDAADPRWLRAYHQGTSQGTLVLSAGRRELAPEAPATKHAALVVDVGLDPNTWRPMSLPDTPTRRPDLLDRIAEWAIDPRTAWSRGVMRRRIRARFRQLLETA